MGVPTLRLYYRCTRHGSAQLWAAVMPMQSSALSFPHTIFYLQIHPVPNYSCIIYTSAVIHLITRHQTTVRHGVQVLAACWCRVQTRSALFTPVSTKHRSACSPPHSSLFSSPQPDHNLELSPQHHLTQPSPHWALPAAPWCEGDFRSWDSGTLCQNSIDGKIEEL